MTAVADESLLPRRAFGGRATASTCNWLSYYGENGIDAWMIPYFGASAYDDPAIYARSSAINYMQNVKSPVFCLRWGTRHRMPAAADAGILAAMKAMNVPTSIMIYPGEGHGLHDPENLADATQRIVAWFDRYRK